MARISIYVTDELKARMAEVGDALNWSDIARPAFETAIATFNHRKGQTMDTAIQRLRASKENSQHSEAAEAKQVGRDWASDHATYNNLQRLSRINLDVYEHDPGAVWRPIKKAVDPQDETDDRSILEYLFGDEEPPEGEWLLAWAEGAQEFFEEVSDQI